IVLTKADEVKPGELAAVLEATAAALANHAAAFPESLATSARSGAGIPELRAAVARLLAEHSRYRMTTKGSEMVGRLSPVRARRAISRCPRPVRSSQLCCRAHLRPPCNTLIQRVF